MTEAEKILKSLTLAGAEWELTEEGRGKKEEAEGHGMQTAPASSNFSPPSSFSAPRASAPISNGSVMEAAKRRAAEPDIIAAIKDFTEHPLFAGAKNTVAPRLPIVNCPLSILVITDIPSLSDDSAGAILTGAEGELMDKMLGAIRLSRERIAITPLVFWRPAGGRTPTKDELAFCRPFVDRVIETVRPKKILTLGALAAREIAGAALPKDHGIFFERSMGKFSSNIIPIYKPEFILQNPAVKRDVWEALKKVISEK